MYRLTQILSIVAVVTFAYAQWRGYEPNFFSRPTATRLTTSNSYHK